MPIRRAETSDLPAVLALFRTCVACMEREGISQWDEVYPNADTVRADTERRELFVLESEGGLIGVITLNERQEPEYQTVRWQLDGKTLVVHRLAVAPAFQGRRVAGLLMAFAHGYARTRGYATVRLDAFSGNPAALALYQGLGYRRAGTVQFRKGEFHCFEISVR
ncbi:GNAT family N-acetyltransferase [Geomesophilobacter sediminis]|uniref:GNAT family N-acetyltransferase n=1 Tax=Geomesophilobacter sediminis TaxID=2798584 RepID=A0A8J7JEB7_9BACT|nr:GNAT family N-acetyltransferase [Geomesophilobacter sediminis]MBJ6724344.1 GNAT family N-acetyltransferase [Geomesophilobacter sediminis]